MTTEVTSSPYQTREEPTYEQICTHFKDRMRSEISDMDQTNTSPEIVHINDNLYNGNGLSKDLVINDSMYDGSGLSKEIIVNYVKIKLKPIPIEADGKTPATSINRDPEIHLFKHVATTHGQMSVDGQIKYLNELHIVSEEVFTTLAREGFVEKMCQRTFVINGEGSLKWSRKIFWLSTIQHPPLSTAEFTIKTDDSLGHSLLPPSFRHKRRHYQSLGQNEVTASDEIYPWLIKILQPNIPEYLKQEGIEDIKFGDKSLYIFVKDVEPSVVEVPLKGSTPNERILFWDENKQQILDAIKDKSSKVKETLLTCILSQLGKLTLENQRAGEARLTPPKPTPIMSFRSKDSNCFVVSSKESAPLAREVLLTINRYLDWNRDSKFGKDALPTFLLRTVKGLIALKGSCLESTTIYKTIEASLISGRKIGRQSYDSIEFGQISHKQIVSILIRVFGAKKYGKHGKARKLVFDLDKLDRIEHDFAEKRGHMGTHAAESPQEIAASTSVPVFASSAPIATAIITTSVTGGEAAPGHSTSHFHSTPLPLPLPLSLSASPYCCFYPYCSFFISTLYNASPCVPLPASPDSAKDIPGDALTSDIELDQRRVKVKELIEKGYSQRQVAQLIGKSQKTIIRDLRRLKGDALTSDTCDALTSDIASEGTHGDTSCKVPMKKEPLASGEGIKIGKDGVNSSNVGNASTSTPPLDEVNNFQVNGIKYVDKPPLNKTDSRESGVKTDQTLFKYMTHQATSTGDTEEIVHPQHIEVEAAKPSKSLFWEAFYDSEKNGVSYLGDILDVLEKDGISTEDALQMVIEVKEEGRVRYNDSDMEIVMVK